MSRAGGGRPTTAMIARKLTVRSFADAGLFGARIGERAEIKAIRSIGERQEVMTINASIAAHRIDMQARFAAEFSNGDRAEVEQYLMLVSTPQHYGGRRWWFSCPCTGRRVLTLYRPAWSRTWASRHFYRLAYASTRQSARDRCLTQSHLLRQRLDPETEYADPTPDKPKGMWWRTYDRHCARIDDQEDRINGFLNAAVERLRARANHA